MKNLICILLLACSFTLSAQKLVDKGSYVLYANGTGDTLTIQKDKITVHQQGIIVYLDIEGRDVSVPLMYDDFSYANPTLLRQYIDRIIMQPTVKIYSVQKTADTLIATSSDKIISFDCVVDEVSTDSMEVISTLGSIGNMVSDTVIYGPGEGVRFFLDKGILYYAKFMARPGCRFTFNAIKYE